MCRVGGALAPGTPSANYALSATTPRAYSTPAATGSFTPGPTTAFTPASAAASAAAAAATPGASAHTPAPVATPMSNAAAGAAGASGAASGGSVGTWRISGVDVARNGERLGTLLSVDDEKAHVRRTDGTDIR
jgi:hypothetical protein